MSTSRTDRPPSGSRRALLRAAAAGVALPPLAAPAEDAAGPVRVAEFPAVQYLEPVVELQQLLDPLVVGVQNETNWPGIRRSLDKFFSGGPGGIFSDSFFYVGASAQYVFKIRYEGSGPDVDADRLARQEPIVNTMDALRGLQRELKDPLPAPAVIRGCAKRAQDGVTRWLEQVPAEDVARVGALIKAVRAADVDRNGELSPAELSTLSPLDQSTWKARQELFG